MIRFPFIPAESAPRLMAGLLASVLIASGCSKKDAEPEVAATPAAETTPAATENSESDSGGTTDAVVIDASQQVTPADYEAAVKGKDWVRAADAVLRMNVQNTAGANSISRMHELQDEIARGVAAGDPNAKRAAEMLRRIGRMPNQSGGN